MGFLDFAETQYIKTIDTGEQPRMGTFKVTQNSELKYMRVKPYIQGTLVGTEKIRLKIYSDTTFTSLLYTSSWSNLYEVVDENGDVATGDWLGIIRIDFNRENLNKNITYYVVAELTGYTRNADTFYIGLSYDFPFPIYDNGQSLYYNHPIAFEIFTYIERT